MNEHPNKHLIPKKIIDKNGKETTVYVAPGEKKTVSAPSQGSLFNIAKDDSSDENTVSRLTYLDSSRFVDPHNPDNFKKPYGISDPEIQQGKVVEMIKSRGSLFVRKSDNVVPRYPTKIRIQTNRIINKKDREKLVRMIQYSYSVAFGIKSNSPSFKDSDYSFVLDVNLFKHVAGRRSNLEYIEDFEEKLAGYIKEGTPTRKTDRSGQNTKGTRLIEGFNEENLAVEIYYNDVYLKDEDLVIRHQDNNK